MVVNVDWIAGKPPVAEPACGYRGQKCISKFIILLSSLLLEIGVVTIIVA